MAAHSVFGFLFLLLLLAAVEGGDEGGDYISHESPQPHPCGYLGKIHAPFTTRPDPKCGLQISGCDTVDHTAVKEIQLKNHGYEIDSIYHDDNHSSIFIYNVAAAEIVSWNAEDTPFYIKNTNTISINSSICSNSSTPGPGIEHMFKRHCPSHVINYNSTYQEHKFPPFHLLLCSLQVADSPECVSSISFLIIEIKLKSWVQCRQNANISIFILNDIAPNSSGTKDKEGPLSPPQTNDKEGHLKAAVIGLSIGLLATVFTIASFAIAFLYKRTNKSSGFQNKPTSTYSDPCRGISNPESRAVYFGIPVFSYEELQQATNNFDQARELGEGGFGTVYYGKLRDGREVAVKRLFERNYRPVESFINEIQILTRMRHKYLVSLYGCTSRHSRELLLVYEYVPNGTLSCHLHGDKAKHGILPWPVRMRIAIDIASALTYLHASDIIHRDVKSSNILIDNNFCVKVADFGLSRLFPNDVTHVSTAPKGTPGYVDPDYRLCYQLTTKSDVYSFGVVLVELISSKPAVDMSRDRDEIKLANLAIRRIQTRAFCELIDPSLGFQSDDKLKRTIISVAELAFQCLQGEKELRPSMSEVLEVLQGIESEKDELGSFEGIEIHGARVPQSYTHPPLPNMTPQHHHQTL